MLYFRRVLDVCVFFVMVLWTMTENDDDDDDDDDDEEVISCISKHSQMVTLESFAFGAIQVVCIFLHPSCE